MANRVFLLASDRLTLSYQEADDDEVVCASSYMLPLYWMMLFDGDSIVEAEVVDEDGMPISYPRLVAPAEKALPLARTRWSSLESIIGESHKRSFSQFIQYLEGRSGEFVQVETYELWMMYEEGEFLPLLGEMLNAFNSDPLAVRGWFKRKWVSSTWEKFLSHVITFKTLDNLQDIETYRLCGYSWIQPVPWEDE
ncbi:MAG: hypothetical protein R3C10_02675 [Pirellulales bacterium]